jgi:hypothetical protein
MKSSKNAVFAFVFVVFLSLSAVSQPKLKAEEILAKHLAAIGTTEAIAAAMSRKIEGTATARNVRMPTLAVSGGAFIASTATMNAFAIAFNASSVSDYRGERIVYDGKKVAIPFVTAAERSPVGAFIFEYPEIAKGYIFGGVLHASWALADASKIGKFELQGKEKLDGVEAYKMKFTPKGGTSLNIRMFFDAADFRHLRTEITRTETAGTVRVDEGRLNENRYKLIEDFSDFRAINGLTLPNTYKVTYRYETGQRSAEFEWILKLTRFGFEPQGEPEIFRAPGIP